VTRTVRVDGRITVTEVGDVVAAGRTPSQLRDALRDLYAKTGILQGEPKITVNVDYVNLDRFESMSRDVTVRRERKHPAAELYGRCEVAGLTVSEACNAIQAQAAKVLRNPPVASVNILPAVNAQLNAMKDPSWSSRTARCPCRAWNRPGGSYGIEELKKRAHASLQRFCAITRSNP